MKKSVFQKLVIWIFAIWSMFLVVLNLLGIADRLSKPLLSWVIGLSLFAGSVLFCLLGSFLLFKIKRKWVQAILIFMLAFGIRIGAWFLFSPEQFSDYKTFFRAASFLYEGDLAFLSGHYWQTWSYQLGFPWLMAKLCGLFGTMSVTLCVLIGSVASAACSVLVFLIVDRFASGKPALAAGLFWCVMLFSVNLSLLVTNQNLSMLFLLLALLILSGYEADWRRAVFVGLLLTAANFIRTDVVIYPAAILVGGVLSLRRKEKRLSDGHNRVFFCALLCTVIYFAAGKVLDLAFTTLNPAGLGNHFPLYKFAVGLNQESFGEYSQVLDAALFSDPACIADPAYRDTLTKELIGQELSAGVVPLVRLMLHKCRSLWCGAGYSFDLLHSALESGSLNIGPFSLYPSFFNYGLQICEVLQRTVLLAAGAAAALQERKKPDGSARITWMLAVLAFSAVSLVIEVQYRYSFIVMPVYCFLLAEAGRKEKII